MSSQTNVTLPTSIFDIMTNATDGTNPFSYAVLALEKLEKPPSGASLRYGLMAFSGVYAAIMLCCLAILIVPFFQGEVGGAQNNWIVKRKYSASYKSPYFILNNGVVIGASYLLGGTLFQLYVGHQFNTMNSNRSNSPFSWVEIFKLPFSCATFIQAFTMLFISASNPSQGGSKRYSIPPAVFNFFLIGFPALIVVVSLYLVGYKVVSFQQQDASYNFLINLLADAGNLWDGGNLILADSQKASLQSAYEVFTRHTLQKNESRFRIGILWSVVDIPAIVFYLAGVSALVTTVYQPIKTPKKLETIAYSLDEKIKAPPVQMFGSAPIVLKKESPNPLARSLKYLWFHNLAMSIALSMDLGTSMIFYLNNDNLKQLRMAGKFLITNLLSALFILLALVILLARIIGDGEEAKKSAAKCTSDYEGGHSGSLKLVPEKK
ncbi:hypothetical protein PGTUg99_007685 [Puccinia graminis f. sp. tritici]|uniref:Uncharacterized protein n=3 Tax=Puccinia graminis f. sp. tritici TaxID=56615 RepID=A0A5B0SG67_PUCGR|nr:hypothetical protein PGTUg99_007685 [Puccinia graminis f. sp. tritici]